MPNTKSAERRMRNSARKQIRNRSINTRLHSLENKFLATISGGKKDEATKSFQAVSSAWDKAAKSGIVPKSRADRKKSRLAIRLAKLK